MRLMNVAAILLVQIMNNAWVLVKEADPGYYSIILQDIIYIIMNLTYLFYY